MNVVMLKNRVALMAAKRRICELSCALFIVFTFGVSSAYAADPELFKPLPVTALADANQSKGVNKIKLRPTTESVNLVTLNINALSGNTTQMSLADTKPLSYTKTTAEYRSSTDFSWAGVATQDSGTATLVIRNGNITGTIRNPSGLYHVESVGNGIHAIIKINESRFPPEEPPFFKEIEKRSQVSPAGKLDNMPGADAGACSEIDVLVAYTPAARDAVADIAATIQLAVDEANQSYVNSGINIKLKLVDTMEVAYTETGKSYDTILADFVANPDIKARRNSSGADLSAMIINQSDYCGLADAIMADASTAFAIVHYSCATGYYSFAHELGHLMGARHDPASDPTSTPFAYGHGYQYTSSAPSWRTIMAYNCAGGCSRLQYWSNPNVNHNGIPMGTANISNNARVLNETACTVAGFNKLRIPKPIISQEVANILFGVIQDGGGLVIVGGKIIKVPPRSPLLKNLNSINGTRLH